MVGGLELVNSHRSGVDNNGNVVKRVGHVFDDGRLQAVAPFDLWTVDK